MEAVFRKEIIVNKTLSQAMWVLTFVILTSLGAFVRIPLPFTPVPITLQTLFVLLAGILLGGNLGSISQLIYLLLGVSGVPIFTGAVSGLSYIFGPTGGYLWGFVLANLFLARFVRYAKTNLLAIFGLVCMADFLILASGVAWLKLISGYSLGKLLFIGFIPFIPGDLLKALIASILYLKLKTRLKELST